MKLKTFSLLLLVVLLGTTGFNAVAQDTDFEIIYQRCTSDTSIKALRRQP